MTARVLESAVRAAVEHSSLPFIKSALVAAAGHLSRLMGHIFKNVSWKQKARSSAMTKAKEGRYRNDLTSHRKGTISEEIVG